MLFDYSIKVIHTKKLQEKMVDAIHRKTIENRKFDKRIDIRIKIVRIPLIWLDIESVFQNKFLKNITWFLLLLSVVVGGGGNGVLICQTVKILEYNLYNHLGTSHKKYTRQTLLTPKYTQWSEEAIFDDFKLVCLP